MDRVTKGARGDWYWFESSLSGGPYWAMNLAASSPCAWACEVPPPAAAGPLMARQQTKVTTKAMPAMAPTQPNTAAMFTERSFGVGAIFTGAGGGGGVAPGTFAPQFGQAVKRVLICFA